MNKLIDKINKKENTIMVVCILIIFACIVFFFYLYGKQINENEFVYKEHLDEKVLTITSDKRSTDILLNDFSYYVIVSEANTQQQALFFHKDDSTNYWNLRTTPIENIRDIAKEFCIDTCVHDIILYMEATGEGIELSDDDISYLKDNAYEIFSSLTGEQMDATNIELETIYSTLEKIFVSEKYILSLVDNGTIEKKSDISVNGTYYLDTIKPNYTIKENNSIIDELFFGSITVNTNVGE